MKFRTKLYNAPAWTYTVIVTLAIAYLTLFPKPLPDTGFKWWEHTDKIIHALMFGGFTGALIYDIFRRNGGKISSKCIFFICLGAIVFGGVIEIAQWAMKAGRSGDLYDLAADAAGAILFALISKSIITRWFAPKVA